MTKNEIEDFIRSYLAKNLKIPPEGVERDVTFDRYGVDSFIAVSMTAELSEMLETEISPTLLYEKPTLRQLSEYLCDGALQRSEPA